MASNKNGNNSKKGDTRGPHIPIPPEDLKGHPPAGEVLGASESLLHSIFAQSPYPMWIADAHGTLIWLNQSCQDLLALTAAEVVGKYNVFQDNIVEEQGFFPILQRVFDKGETVRFELSYDTSQLKTLPLKTAVSVILDVTVSPIRDARGRITNAVFQHVDITERKQAEAALAESEQRFQTFMDHLPAAAFIKDQEGRLLFANRYLRETFGWEDCLGKTTEELVPPELAGAMVADDRRALAQGPQAIQEKIIDAQGQEHFFDTYKFPVEAGDALLLGGIAVDVTARKRAEKAIHNSERRFRALIENSPDAIILFGEGGKILYGSPSTTRVLGYDLLELKRHTAFSLVHPEDLPAVQALMNELLQNPGKTRSSTFRILHQDGSWRYLEGNYTNLLGDPSVGAIVNNYRDVTERRLAEKALELSEKKYRSFYQSILDGFGRADMTGKIVETNQGFLDMLGYTQEEILDLRYQDITPAKWHKFEADIIEHQVLTRGYSDAYEKEYIRKDGAIFAAELRTYLIEDETGEPAGMWAFIRDITDRKQAEEALRESEERYRSLFQNHHTVMLLVDPETGSIMDANPAACAFYSFSKEELLTKKTTDLNTLPPDQVFRAMQRAKTEKRKHFEFQHRLASGEIRDVEVFTGPIRVKGQDLLYSIIHDTTARKRAEKALRESEEKYRSLFQEFQGILNAVPDTLCLLSPDLKIIWGNEATALHINQPGVSTLIGQHCYPYRHDRDEPCDNCPVVRCFSSGQMETEEVFAHGNIWELRAFPIYDDHGELRGAIEMARKITERKRMEEALRESQALYHDLVETAQDLIWQCDSEGRYTYLNPAWEEVFGYQVEEMLGRRFTDFQPPEYAARDLQEFVRLLEGNFVKGLETVHLAKDGRELHLVFNAKVVRDQDGYVSGTRGTAYNITKRKLAEEKLRESEQRFRSLVETTSDWVWEVDQNALYTYASPKVQDLLGYRPDEVIGKSPLDFMPPDEAKRIKSELQDLKKSHEPFSGLENMFLHKDGRQVLLETSGVPVFDQNGVFSGFRGIDRDITQRKQAEEALRQSEARFRQVVESSPLPIGLAAITGTIEYLNRKFVETFGYTLEDIPRLEDWFRLAYPDPAYRQMVFSQWQESLEKNALNNLTAKAREVEITCKDNSKRIMEVFGTLMGNKSLVVFNDLTERKRMEETLRQKEQKYRSLYLEFQGIVNTIPDLLCLVSPDLKIVWANEATAVALNKSSLSEVIGKHCYPLRHDRSEPCDPCPVARCMVSGQMETEEVFSHGGIWELRAVPIYDDQGQVRGAIEVARNVTERKQAEEALRESEERLRLALQAANQGLYDLNIQTGEAKVTPEYATMLGYDPAEFQETNARWIERLHPDDREAVAATYRAYVRGDIPDYTVEFRQRTKTGDWKWILSLGKIVAWDEDGQPLRMLGTHTDITARKQAEELIRTEKSFSDAIIDSLPGVFYMFDEQGKFIRWNNTLEEVTGYSDAEISFLRPINFFEGEDRELIARRIKLAFAEGSANAEANIVTKHGQRIPYYFTGSRTTIGDKANIIGLGIDITIRKKVEEALRNSERRLSEIIDFLPDATFAIDLEGRVIAWNRAIEEMTGIQAEEMIGKGNYEYALPFYGVRRPILIDLTFKSDAEIEKKYTFVKKEGDILLAEAEVPLKGERHFLWGKARPLYDSEGDIVGAIEAIRDISERQRAEEERAKMEAQMREVQKLESLGVLAGGIAHDFNNLLMAILGNADLALLGLSPASPARPHVEEITRGAMRAADLCRQMLAYSGKGRFFIGRYNLSEIVQEMTQMLKVSVSKKANLRYSFAADLPAVEVDATQMRQVVMNLIINASESLGDQTGFISVATGVMDCDRTYLSESFLDDKLPEGQYVYLEVADTGCGMDEDTRRRIFDPFFTTKFTGRGLGLAAVLGIVRGHQGAIKVYSEPGQGTTFKVLLPAVEWAPGERDATAPTGSRQLQGGTILLVDDDSHVRQVVTAMLERLGFEVLTAANGREGLEVFRANRDQITCVLLDLTMPEMAGDEVFRELRRLRKDVLVILSSGFNEQEVTQRFAGKGLAVFVQKPYTVRALQKALIQVLGPA